MANQILDGDPPEVWSTAQRLHDLGLDRQVIATYVRHVGERPMAITWTLYHPLPGDLFASFAAAVA